MIDTNIYTHLTSDGPLFQQVKQLVKNKTIEILTTHIQEDEVNKIKDDDFKAKLFEVPTDEVSTSVFILNHSRLGKAKLGAGNTDGVDFVKIQKSNNKHTNDAIIAVTAAGEADIFVTDDKKLRSKINAVLPKMQVIDFLEFKKIIAPLR